MFKLIGANRAPKVIEFPGGVGLLNDSNNTKTERYTPDTDPIYYDALEFAGAWPRNGYPQERDYRRISVYDPASKDRHLIRAGEIIPLFQTTESIRPTVATDAAQIYEDLQSEVRFDLAVKYPHLANAIQMFGDQRDKPARTEAERDEDKSRTGDGRDLAWWVRNFGEVSGERQHPPLGLNQTMIRAQDGLNNCEYDSLFWCGVKWLLTRRDADWWFGVSQAITVACQGVLHSGPQSGMMRYPKGSGFNGDYYAPSHSKQHQWRGLYLWNRLLNNHPLTRKALDAFEARFAIDYDWSGKWGSRIGAVYLDNLRLAFEETGHNVYRDLAAEEIPRVWGFLQPGDKYWMNRGSSAAPESPWMIYQLIEAIAKWHYMGVESNLTRLTEIVNNVHAEALTRVGNYPALMYRIGTTVEPPTAVSLLAWALPVMRRWDYPQLAECEDFVYTNIGSTFSHLFKHGVPLAPSEVGIATGPEGLGGLKARSYTMRSLLR